MARLFLFRLGDTSRFVNATPTFWPAVLLFFAPVAGVDQSRTVTP